MAWKPICAVLALSFTAACAWADSIELDNGDRISGTIAGLEGGKLVIKTEYAGNVAVQFSRIRLVRSEEPVTLVLKDETRIAGPLGGTGTALSVQQPGFAERLVDPASLKDITQGVMLVDQWRYEGRINLGASSSSGNTKVRRLNVDTEAIARRQRDRITANLRGNYAEDEGDNTESNAVLGAKYDRFLNPKWYAYAATTFEHDPFRDIRVRGTLGGGSGYQVFDTSVTSLSFEGGLDYVVTDYYDETDEHFPAARLGLRFRHWLWKDVLEIFNTTEGYASLVDSRTSFVRTQTGLRVPLKDRFLAQAQLNYDWQGNPSPGREAVDQTLVFSIGYKW